MVLAFLSSQESDLETHIELSFQPILEVLWEKESHKDTNERLPTTAQTKGPPASATCELGSQACTPFLVTALFITYLQIYVQLTFHVY